MREMVQTGNLKWFRLGIKNGSDWKSEMVQTGNQKWFRLEI
jgi:hypothetical protein